MQLVALFLLLLSVGLVVAPVGTVAVMNRDDVSQLFIPTKVKAMMYGDTSYLLNSSNTKCGSYDNYNVSILGGLITPKVVNITVNQTAKAFAVVVNITNNFSHSLTLNNLTATIRTSQDHSTLLTISLKEPVTIVSHDTSAVTVIGHWTKTTEDYLKTKHVGASTIGVELTNVSIEINRLLLRLAGPIKAGNIPLIWEG